MKVRFLVASMMLALVALACGNTPKKSEAMVATPLVEEATLPEGAIPFSYDRHLVFDVMIRDSVKARMIFDAGSTNLVLDKAFYDERFAASGVKILTFKKLPWRINRCDTTVKHKRTSVSKFCAKLNIV